MADPLQSARIKLNRASLHTRTSEREAKRFLDKNPAPIVEVRPDGEPPAVLQIGDTVDLVIGFQEGGGASYPDLPDSFSARFGDAIQNYRSALDHLAWQLVKHGSTPNPQKPTLVQFPICERERDFRSSLAARLPGVSRASGGPCDFIRYAHEFRGGKAKNDLLLLLAKLSNDDKHRALHTTVAALHGAEHHASFTDCRPVDFKNPAVAPAIRPGAVIAHMRVEVTGPNPRVEVEPKLRGYIALEGSINAMDILRDMRGEIGIILKAPEILGAL